MGCRPPRRAAATRGRRPARRRRVTCPRWWRRTGPQGQGGLGGRDGQRIDVGRPQPRTMSAGSSPRWREVARGGEQQRAAAAGRVADDRAAAPAERPLRRGCPPPAGVGCSGRPAGAGWRAPNEPSSSVPELLGLAGHRHRRRTAAGEPPERQVVGQGSMPSTRRAAELRRARSTPRDQRRACRRGLHASETDGHGATATCGRH